ncbi:hypothetical protein Tco_1187935 [Tanacetum coccineum]
MRKSDSCEMESLNRHNDCNDVAADEGLSTFTRSGAGEREAHKIGKPAFKGGVTSLKVYNEEEKDKIGVRGIDQDRLAA